MQRVLSIPMVAPEIAALALDVDGVLTDGTFWWGAGGEEFKRFSFADVMGVSLATKAGLRVALVSGEDSPQIDRFAHKMKLTDVYKGCRDKAAAVRDLAERHRLRLGQICFVGDDVNDIPALECVGLPVAVASANALVLSHAAYTTDRSGGDGAVREVVDMLLAARHEVNPVAVR